MTTSGRRTCLRAAVDETWQITLPCHFLVPNCRVEVQHWQTSPQLALPAAAFVPMEQVVVDLSLAMPLQLLFSNGTVIDVQPHVCHCLVRLPL